MTHFRLDPPRINKVDRKQRYSYCNECLGSRQMMCAAATAPDTFTKNVIGNGSRRRCCIVHRSLISVKKSRYKKRNDFA